MEIYEPYNFESFKNLVAYAYSIGWFSGRKKAFVLTCESEFEGFYGRATEGWNVRFTITSDEIQFDGKEGRKIPALNIEGRSVEEVCAKALKALQPPPKESLAE
jgi:hypothetical protein